MSLFSGEYLLSSQVLINQEIQAFFLFLSPVKFGPMFITDKLKYMCVIFFFFIIISDENFTLAILHQYQRFFFFIFFSKQIV